jgi:hypothetical protein
MRKLSSNHFEDPKGSFRAFLNRFFYRQVRIVQGERHRLKLETSCTHLQDGKPSPSEIGKQRGGGRGTERQRFKETGIQIILSIPAKRKLKATTRMSLQSYNAMFFVMQTPKKK